MRSKRLIVALPGNEYLAGSIASVVGGEVGELEVRRFPDEESYTCYCVALAGRHLSLVCTLDRPDGKFLPLVFAADAARDLGAQSVGLIAPYLCYMRQDRSFQEGEAITSATFAAMLSEHFDWLITIDPHLHRYSSLSEIYAIPTRVLRAAPLLSQWIRKSVEMPLVLGPDEESEQWVAAVADAAGCPYSVARKARRGDREVTVKFDRSALAVQRDRAPVLVDDVISSGQTMIEAAKQLVDAGMRSPVCVGVHGLFASDAYEELRASGVVKIVTSNSIASPTAKIDVSALLAEGLMALQP